MFRKLIPLLGACALACGGASSTGPRPLTLDMIVGEWRLQSADGAKPPFVWTQGSNYTMTLTDSYVDLDVGNAFTQTFYFSTTFTGQAAQSTSGASKGQFQLSVTSVVLPDWIGTLDASGQILTLIGIESPHATWIYKKQ